MKKSNTLVLVAYGLIGLAAFSCIFFIFAAAYSSIETITVKSLESRSIEYEDKAEDFSTLESLYNEWKNMDQIYSQFKNDYLIKFDDYPNFRNEMQSIFSQNGLQVLKMNHRYKNLFEDIRQVSIDLQVVGNYRDIKRFIFEIENKGQMVFFDNISLSKYEVGDRAMGKISMEVYFVR